MEESKRGYLRISHRIHFSNDMFPKTQIERGNDSIYFGYRIHNVCNVMYKIKCILCFKHNE